MQLVHLEECALRAPAGYRGLWRYRHGGTAYAVATDGIAFLALAGVNHAYEGEELPLARAQVAPLFALPCPGTVRPFDLWRWTGPYEPPRPTRCLCCGGTAVFRAATGARGPCPHCQTGTVRPPIVRPWRLGPAVLDRNRIARHLRGVIEEPLAYGLADDGAFIVFRGQRWLLAVAAMRLPGDALALDGWPPG